MAEEKEKMMRTSLPPQLMGIEIDTDHGGSGSTFFSSVVAIEELAKVDAAVSVLCDVQNTLVIDFLRCFAGQNLRDKYFPLLATNTVSSSPNRSPRLGLIYLGWMLLFVRATVW